ncbi:MAG: hemolysin family protein [Acidobacteriaceae bacterium]
MLEWVLVRAVAVAFLILANSFFVAAEFALVSVRETRLEQLIALGRPNARTAMRLKHSLDEFLPAVQLGVTLASLALGWIGEQGVAETFESWFSGIAHIRMYANFLAVPLAFAFITYLHVLLGELVPKSLALQRADQIALAVAGPMDIFIRLTRPIVDLMNSSARLVLRGFHAPMRDQAAVHSPEELKLIATATRRMGLLPAFQEGIIHRAIELNDVLVREVMTPRRRIFALSADLPIEEANARIIEEQHSRVPVYDPERGPEYIIGVAYSKDLSRLMHFRSAQRAEAPSAGSAPSAPSAGSAGSAGSAQVGLLPPFRAPFSELRLRQVMREVIVVPETKLVVDLLQEFKQRRRQMAIVVDEFGSTVGLVTAEDALEQIVGEMEDEFDIAAKPVLNMAQGALLLEGSVNLRDLETQVQWLLPRDAGIETLAGFVLARLGHIPEVGESVEFEGRRLTVTEMQGHRIGMVKVEDKEAAQSQQQKIGQASRAVGEVKRA